MAEEQSDYFSYLPPSFEGSHLFVGAVLGRPRMEEITEAHRLDGEELSRAAGADRFAGDLLRIRQVHGTKIVGVEEDAASPESVCEADGAVATVSDVALRILVADCMPIFLYAPKQRACSLVHGGWRGLAAGIASRALEALTSLGAAPGDIVARIGPHIGPCCYEVGEEVCDAFGPRCVARRNSGGRWIIDLQSILCRDLVKEGVLSLEGHETPPCTRCNSEKFYSHRAGTAGRNVAYLQILDPT